MFSAKPCDFPASSDLIQFSHVLGAHTDCYCVEVGSPVSLEDYAMAFFDSPVFRLERRLIALFGGIASTRQDVAAIADGTGDALCMWQVISRDKDQILLAVGKGPIRTWIMRETNGRATQLYFGSAVLPNRRSDPPRIGFSFRALKGFHSLYSRILLSSARRQVLRATI